MFLSSLSSSFSWKLKMYCIHCGTELKENSKFCGNCGVKVPDADGVREKDFAVLPIEENMSEGAVLPDLPVLSEGAVLPDLPVLSEGAVLPDLPVLSEGAKESLAFLKDKYGTNHSSRTNASKKKASKCSKELLIHIMDRKKKALKRAFPSETGLSGCLKIQTNYTETSKDWIANLKTFFAGDLEFVLFIMGKDGLETIDSHLTLGKLEKCALRKKPLKVYAQVKGKERHEILQKFKKKKISEVSVSDEELPDIDFLRSLPKKEKEFPSEESKKRNRSADELMPGPSGCKGENEVVEQSISEDFKPQYIELPMGNEPDDLPIMDQEVTNFFDIMEKKIKRKKMADEIDILFPSSGKTVTVVYQEHGGMSFARPFELEDTLQSVYAFLCQVVEPEILPSTFHLECVTPTSCILQDCIHCYELTECWDMAISKIPSLLLLKEGNYLMDETMTFFGSVFLQNLNCSE